MVKNKELGTGGQDTRAVAALVTTYAQAGPLISGKRHFYICGHII
jgi:hypothetical protein